MSTDLSALKPWRAAGTVILLGATSLAGFAQSPGTNVQAAASLAKPAGVRASAPAAAAISSSVRVLLLPAGETVLSSPVAGRVTQLHVSLGAHFKQGTVLVSMDCDEPQARLAMAKADQAAATEQFEAKLRMQGLEQASEIEVALAASAVAKAKALVELHQFQIAQCTIRAPWSGRIVKRHVHSHMTVSAGQPLLELVRSGFLSVKLNVPSSWISTLKIGHVFDLTIDETGQTYEARVQHINGRVDPVSQTIELEATMTKLYPDLLPGMSGVANFARLQ